ncbi:hypothetical protein I4I73_03465 [Pseudonocardia sp. KRD-184]|uniref:Inorganic diphosphatase n=1 Tax=Pseudonocardia oceani TaxID=2792013 RepID=A0ABS6UG77_9PSEU|nr:hypothetical protein [Pseudonocardia oceani]MBW0088274.1 hypothetical protein [Pseudonocardia oceani]MBW0095056.1 hypothetical protein [Pseudonocardia oceani]MBW0121091.1 hypothetical protein [Pseudonocardia oceani]MBW0131223.1 hypothetical protein [Pseudonocardia oceani]MBW0132610.1 hypothetical protein [Pseudonocardia oceani]
MSIYCSFGLFGDDGDDYPAPLIYRQSHVLPTVDDPRGGTLDLAYIPGFITRDGRDVDGELDPDCENDGVWPFLRVSLRAEQGLAMVEAGEPEDTVVLDRDQVATLRDELTDWLLRHDDLDTWLDQHTTGGER